MDDRLDRKNQNNAGEMSFRLLMYSRPLATQRKKTKRRYVDGDYCSVMGWEAIPTTAKRSCLLSVFLFYLSATLPHFSLLPYVYIREKTFQFAPWKLQLSISCSPLSPNKERQKSESVWPSKITQAGEVLFSEAPLVVGPACVTLPVCLACYTPVDGSYR